MLPEEMPVPTILLLISGFCQVAQAEIPTEEVLQHPLAGLTVLHTAINQYAAADTLQDIPDLRPVGVLHLQAGVQVGLAHTLQVEVAAAADQALAEATRQDRDLTLQEAAVGLLLAAVAVVQLEDQVEEINLF